MANLLKLLFPEHQPTRNIPFYTQILIFLLATAAFTVAFSQIDHPMFAFDFKHFWGIGIIPPWYPPFAKVAAYLSLPVLTGITLASFLLAVIRRSVHTVSAACAFLSFPLLWTVFLGQLDGLSLLGTLVLPLAVPLVLIKPQVALFALGAKWQYLVAFVVVMVVSLLVWGDWISPMLNANSYHAEGRFENNIGLGVYGIPLFLLTVWFSRGDPDMLMASGAFITPYLIVYNLLPLSPAVARLKPWTAIIALILSYLTLSSNWLGPVGWWMGWGFVPWVWGNLAWNRYRNERL